MLILEGSNIKAFPGSCPPINNDFSPVTSEIMELPETLMESYRKVHLVIRLDFSLVLHLLKIMGQFAVIVACVALTMNYLLA